MIQQKTVWSDATRSGLVLGAVSISYFFISILLSKLPEGSKALGVLASVGGILLWVAKFVACIMIFKAFMVRFAKAHEGVTNSDTFRFGCATALLSALLFSAFYLAWTTLIDPDMFANNLEQALASSQSMFGAAQLDEMEEMMPKLPAITFFVNLIYCWLFGVILSAIFSRNIPSRNPFSQPQEPDIQ